MAAKDALNKDLFHGTGGAIEGGIVRPGISNFYGKGAYATTSYGTAKYAAQIKAHGEGRLFGTVYKVRPTSKNVKIEEMIEDEDYVIDPKGLKVIKAVSYPINRFAV